MHKITQTFSTDLEKTIDKKLINKLGIWQIFGKHDKLQHHRTTTATAPFCSVKSKQMVLPVLAMMENLNNKHISSYTAHVARCLINLN